jgi:uncharacterized protein YndB with AHSA1/START domain
MNDMTPTNTATTTTDTRSVVIERVMPHPPEKIWRALTQVPLLEDWLLPSDFQPVTGHHFNFRAPPQHGWNGIIDCEILTLEAHKRLAYSWNVLGEQTTNGLKTVVTWTLTPTQEGTRVRMEQSGFRPDQAQASGGATYGWTKFINGLERVLEGPI